MSTHHDRSNRAAYEQLDARHLKPVFRVLEDCDDANSLDEFKKRLTESLAETYRVRSTTFFTGETAALACADPAPRVIGITRHMVPVYQDYWHKYDMFSSPEALSLLHTSRVASVAELRRLNDQARTYLVDYLQHYRIHSSTTMYLDFADGNHALVGLFDRDEDKIGAPELASLRLLARPLNRIARQFSTTRTATTANILDGLSPRHREVARLIGEGLANGDIAAALHVHEDSVKKYVSRILKQTGCHNRTELAIKVRSARADGA